jgi:hypothetical protein
MKIKNLNKDMFSRFFGGEVEIINKVGPSYRGRIAEINLSEDAKLLEILFVVLVERNYITRNFCYHLAKINYKMSFEIKNKIPFSRKILAVELPRSLIVTTLYNEKLVFFTPERNILNIEKALFPDKLFRDKK